MGHHDGLTQVAFQLPDEIVDAVFEGEKGFDQPRYVQRSSLHSPDSPQSLVTSAHGSRAKVAITVLFARTGCHVLHRRRGGSGDA
ncbi:hypothetical protein D3C80_1864740 [compost metagenome]